MTSATQRPTLSATKQFKQFLLEKAPTCIHKPEGLLKYTYVTPTYAVVAGADDKAKVPERSAVGFYLQMYDWDACFFSQAALEMGLGDLAPDIVANFMTLKHPDGYVPRTVSPHRVWDAGDMCKPFLCQALTFRDQHKQRKASAEMLTDLQCYLEYFQRHRRDEKTGLYHWRNVLESGVDDNLALLTPHEAAKDENESVGNFPDGKMLAVDLSAYMVAEFNSFAALAEHGGQNALATKYRQLAKDLAALIEQHMWDEDEAFYCNVFPETGEKLKLQSWTGLTPALLGIATQERTEKLIRRTLLNPEHFYRPCGISSMAASEPLYNNAKRGLYGRAIVSNWQGPMWVLPNALAVRCLLNNGMKNEATEVAGRVVNTIVAGMESRGTMFENYDAETGAPLWAPQFMSWNSLSIELANLLES